MNSSVLIENLQKMLAQGRDSALLRYGLGTEYLKLGAHAEAITHLRTATTLDPGYSAAWKMLGKALSDSGAAEAAMEIYRAGIRAAETKGDLQAAKEMKVFLRRLEQHR